MRIETKHERADRESRIRRLAELAAVEKRARARERRLEAEYRATISPTNNRVIIHPEVLASAGIEVDGDGADDGGLPVSPWLPGDAGTGAAPEADGDELSLSGAALDRIDVMVRSGAAALFVDDTRSVTNPRSDKPLPFHRMSPRDRKALMGLVVALKAQRMGYREIQKATGLSAHVVRVVLAQARQHEGLLDVMADLDYDILPGAIDNYRQAVRDGNLKVSGEILKGRGVLVNHQKSAAVSASLTELRVTYTNAPAEVPLPQSEALQKLVPGVIVGAPRTE